MSNLTETVALNKVIICEGLPHVRDKATEYLGMENYGEANLLSPTQLRLECATDATMFWDFLTRNQMAIIKLELLDSSQGSLKPDGELKEVLPILEELTIDFEIQPAVVESLVAGHPTLKTLNLSWKNANSNRNWTRAGVNSARQMLYRLPQSPHLLAVIQEPTPPTYVMHGQRT
ncbi:hypothetical protein C8R44DRAFT_850122 [Mycena epipterygia]|nr:hypothetical protein C8R44DRAFT_850122 [Mycena epipterygia]